jgi:hypothetical protein
VSAWITGPVFHVDESSNKSSDLLSATTAASRFGAHPLHGVRSPGPTWRRSFAAHLNAFAAFGGGVQRCLYDNAKVVVLGRDSAGEPVWNRLFLDFALRVGFTIQLCAPYRAQTKGRVESGVKYIRGKFWFE